MEKREWLERIRTILLLLIITFANSVTSMLGILQRNQLSMKHPTSPRLDLDCGGNVDRRNIYSVTDRLNSDLYLDLQVPHASCRYLQTS